MTFVAGAVIWAGYTLAWWGWEAITDHVPLGPADQFHWPSIFNLLSPGRISIAVPAKATGPEQILAGGTAASPLAGPASSIVAQPLTDAIGTPLPGGGSIVNVPQNDTFLNPITPT